jgi:hypothetical protein
VARIRLDSRKSVRAFKGIFCDDISEFESDHLSHAVGSLRANMPARCFRANNQLGAAIWIVIQGSGSDVSDAQGFPRLRAFHTLAPCFRQKE